MQKNINIYMIIFLNVFSNKQIPDRYPPKDKYK